MIAGVELDDGRRLWVDAGSCDLHPLDRTVVRLQDGTELSATVFVAPAHLLVGTAPVGGNVILVCEATEPSPHDSLPGADLPPLGSLVEVDGALRLVRALDPVAGTVTFETDTGSETMYRGREPKSGEG